MRSGACSVSTGNRWSYERALIAQSEPQAKLKLILASSSPRRAEILRNAGFAFDIQPAHVDETLLAGERAEDYVRRLADTKARFVAQYASRDTGPAIVIGADTAVVIDGQILGKPADADDARRMLHLLNGTDHEVVTGLAFIRIPAGSDAAQKFDEKARIAGGRSSGISHPLSSAASTPEARFPDFSASSLVESTRVSFLPLSARDIDDYVQTGEPFDKAGAYGIQGIGGRFIRRIEGCYFNVMGLPLSRFSSVIAQMEREP